MEYMISLGIIPKNKHSYNLQSLQLIRFVFQRKLYLHGLTSTGVGWTIRSLHHSLIAFRGPFKSGEHSETLFQTLLPITAKFGTGDEF